MLGEFSFKLKDNRQRELRVLAQIPGYQPYETYATLGARLSFKLQP